MSVFKKKKNRLISIVKAELCRINFKCVIAGAIIILLCGALSAIAGGSAMAFCELERPKGTPPAFIFSIVWTILYILIGGAAGAVACCHDRSVENDKYKGLLFFVIMMIFNFVWFPLFFGAGALFAAFLDIIIMIILTVFTFIFFRRVFKIAGWVMIIYLLWLFYAAFLNLAIIILN